MCTHRHVAACTRPGALHHIRGPHATQLLTVLAILRPQNIYKARRIYFENCCTAVLARVV